MFKLNKKQKEFYRRFFGKLPLEPVGEALINGEKMPVEFIDDSKEDATRVVFIRNGLRVTAFIPPNLVTKYQK